MNVDVIQLGRCLQMKISRTRLICIAGASICFIVAALLAVYVLTSSRNSEANLLKLWLLVACALFGYLGGSAYFNKFLWLRLFRNEAFLSALASIATCVSFFCLVLAFTTFGRMDLNFLLLALLMSSTLVAAACFRLAIGVRAFGWVSLLFSLPTGLISIGPVSYFLFPPPADPVGGAGINAGILIMLMIPFASVGVPTWIAAAYFERWRLRWHVLIALIYLPSALAAGAVFTGIAG